MTSSRSHFWEGQMGTSLGWPGGPSPKTLQLCTRNVFSSSLRGSGQPLSPPNRRKLALPPHWAIWSVLEGQRIRRQAFACWEMAYPEALLVFPEPWTNIYIILLRCFPASHWGENPRTHLGDITPVAETACLSAHNKHRVITEGKIPALKTLGFLSDSTLY